MRIVRRTSTTERAAATAVLAPLGGQPAAQLGHHPVHGGQVLGRPGGQRAIQLAQRLGRRQRLRALDQRPLQFAPHVPLELAQPLARHRVRIRLLGALALALQAQRAADALHVHADHPRALALAAEGGDRQPGEVAQLAVGAVLALQRRRGSGRAAPRGPAAPPGRPGPRAGRRRPPSCRAPLPRAPPRGRRSGRTPARAPGGPPETWPAWPTAPRRSPRGRSSSRCPARRTRRAARTCPPPCPRCAARRPAPAAAAPCRPDRAASRRRPWPSPA